LDRLTDVLRWDDRAGDTLGVGRDERVGTAALAGALRCGDRIGDVLRVVGLAGVTALAGDDCRDGDT